MIKKAVSDLTVVVYGDSWILLYYIEHTLDTVSSKQVETLDKICQPSEPLCSFIYTDVVSSKH